jgi:hypothetical protein
MDRSAARREHFLKKEVSHNERKAYEKPDFQWERVFETMALYCGKVSSTQGSCRLSRKSS